MLIGGIVARADPRPAGRRHDRQPRLRSACAASGCSSSPSILRFGTETLLNARVPIVEALRLPLLASAFGLLLVALWTNRSLPGHRASLRRHPRQRDRHRGQRRLHADLGAEPRSSAGFRPTRSRARSTSSSRRRSTRDFLLHLGPFGDVIPIPLPFIQNVASIGDAVPDGRPGVLPVRRASSACRRTSPGTARLDPRSAGARDRADARDRRERSARDRPAAMLGRRGAAIGVPLGRASSRRLALDAGTAGRREHSRSRPPGRRRVRSLGRSSAAGRGGRASSASIRTSGSRSTARSRRSGRASSSRCSATGSTILRWSRSSTATTGSVFASASSSSPPGSRTCSSGPIAGTFVDRWDHKEVLVVSDILRAALVLLIPLAAVTNIVLSTRCSSSDDHFGLLPAGAGRDPAPDRGRAGPAQRELGAVGRRDAGRRHRLPPGPGLLRGAPRDAVPLAFWVDSATYLASAALLATIVVRATSRAPRADAMAPRPGFVSELVAGLAVPADETDPPRQHDPGRGRLSSRSASSIALTADLRRSRSIANRSAGRRSTASSRPGSGSATSSAGSRSG